MKKVFINILFLFLFILTVNISYGFEVKQISKTEIDKINCDLNFTGELAQGFNYTFSDTFINNSNREVKVIQSEVNVYEEEDFNQSDFFSNVNFSTWALNKNNIFEPGNRGIITELNQNYKVKIGPTKVSQDNFIIKYTLGLYYKGPDGKFSDGPHFHTECKRYKIIGDIPEKKTSSCNGLDIEKNEGIEELTTKITCNVSDISSYKIDCGNGDIFSENISKKGQGEIIKTCKYTKPGKYIASCSVDNKEVTNVCSKKIVIKKETINEKDIKFTYNKYKEIQYNLDLIIKEENEEGKKLITLPKILPKTGTPVLDKVKKLENNKLDLNIDENKFILAGSKNTDINFWKKVLDERDRDAYKYLVIPSNGLVIPINTINSNTSDYNKIISGREIEVNKYLKTGSVEYPGTSINGFGKVGNKVIFGHSSYWKKDNGRYKTDFQKIIELDSAEEVWIYEKNNGVYNRFKYKVKNSYNTKDNDISVLNSGIGKNLTLITCTPIGGISGRWVIEAKYIDDNKIFLENQIKFNSIDRDIKIKIINIVNKLSNSSNGKSKILKIFNTIIIKEKQISKLKETKKIKYIKDILEYLKYKLAIEYYK